MIVPAMSLLIGLVILIKGADLFVDGAARDRGGGCVISFRIAA